MDNKLVFLRILRKNRQEILVGLAMMILLFISIIQLRKGSQVEKRLVLKSIPVQLFTFQLATSMDEQKAALIRYLVDGDSIQKTTYAEMQSEIEYLMRDMLLLSNEEDEIEVIRSLDELLGQLESKGNLVMTMDEYVDENYLEISEAIDDIDDLLDNGINPYVDRLTGIRRKELEETTGELEIGIQECLLALSEYIMHRGAEESRSEFLEARSNLELWENSFIELAANSSERLWSRQLNESMDQIVAKADELMINFDRRMDEYRKYSEMEIKADEYIEKNLLTLSAELVNADLDDLRKDKNTMFIITLVIMSLMVIVIVILNGFKRKKENDLRAIELRHRDSQLKAILESQEKERSRYAQDLHDGYGQLIVVLKLNMESLKRKMELFPSDIARIIENTDNLLQNMSVELRKICYGLMPHTLKERGLDEAIQELAYNINITGKLDVKIDVDELGELEESQKILIFRICQEWMNNILKHSKASTVKIKLMKHSKNFEMTIDDNGGFFDFSLLGKGVGHGWKNIQSRARLLNANVILGRINSDNTGTRFKLQANPTLSH